MKTMKTLFGTLAAVAVMLVSFNAAEAFNCDGDGNCIMEYNGMPITCTIISITLETDVLLPGCPTRTANITVKELECPGGITMQLYSYQESQLVLDGSSCPSFFPATPRVELYCEAFVSGNPQPLRNSVPMVLVGDMVDEFPPQGKIRYVLTDDVVFTDVDQNRLVIAAGSEVEMETN